MTVIGRLRKAPENFIPGDAVARVAAEARGGRRDFIRGAFAVAVAGIAAPLGAQTASAGDPNILSLPEHATGLGQGVATDGYGKPSKHESDI